MTQLKRLLHTSPLFLLTIPLVFLLNAANHYFGLLDWSLVLPAMLLFFVLAAPLSGLIYLLLRSWKKAFWFTGIILIVFYFFSAIHQFLEGSALSILGRYSILLPA